jgi:Predicted NTPase (NACHT family)
MLPTNKKPIEWLQLSDLHVFPEADTSLMLTSYEALAKEFQPQFIVVTGDFRHIKKSSDYKLTLEYLCEIVQIFGVDKKDVFLVPGNHDVNEAEDFTRDGIIYRTIEKTESNYAAYKDHLKALSSAFQEYQHFASLFYQDSGLEKDDLRISAPESVFCSVWNDSINLIHVNTALVSDGKKNSDGSRLHPEILDVNKLSKLLREVDKHRPTIVLAHHGIESLHKEHKIRVEGMLREAHISAYLHGDIHVHREEPIRREEPDRITPEIACGKSAPQAGDDYSDIGVVCYSWREDDAVEVRIYNWTPDHGFARNCKYPFAHGVNNEPYTFRMLYENECESGKPVPETSEIEYLKATIAKNSILKRRDTIDFYAEEWVKLYSYPVFSVRRTSPIPDKRPFRIIVTSPSGDGKSVMLQGLALLYALKCLIEPLPPEYIGFDDSFMLGEKLIPISVRASDFNSGEMKESLLEYAVYSVQDETERPCLDRSTMEDMCKNGKAVLLIDSLDEVLENKTSDFIRLIKAHISTFPKTSVIVTSRNIPGLIDLYNSSFEAVRLCKFGQKQIDSQIEKHCFENAEHIKRRIMGHPYLRKMAASPIMLATMLSRMSNAPEAETVVDFLKLITYSIIRQRWKDFDLLSDEGEGIQFFLAGLAWRLICKNKNSISKDKLYEQIGFVYKDLEKMGCTFNWRESDGTCSIDMHLSTLTADLARRSGILTLDDSNTQFVFQDDLVKWYLGAGYVKLILSESQERRLQSPSEIITPLDKWLYTVPLKGELVHTLIMSVSLLQIPQQKALLQYMLTRAACSIDAEELSAINEGFWDLIKNTFGTNEILNPRVHSCSWEVPSVIRWLCSQGNERTITSLKLKYPMYFTNQH